MYTDLIKINRVKKEIQYECSEDGKRRQIGLREYDEEGKLNGYFSEDNKNEIELYDISTHDKEGNQIMEIFNNCKDFIHGYPQEFSEKTIDFYSKDDSFYVSKTYDNKGRFIEKSGQVIVKKSIGENSKCKYLYNAEGRLLSKYLSRYDNKREIIYWLGYDKSLYCNTKIINTYDKNHNKIKEESWTNYVKGYLEPLKFEHGHWVFEFDERKNRTEERYINPDETILWKDSLSYIHDEKGRLINTIHYDEKGEKSVVDTYFYDDKDNEIKEVSEKSSGEILTEILREYYENGLMKSYTSRYYEPNIFQKFLYEYEYYK